MFCSQIVELTVHLVDDNTGRSEFPDAEGNFDFDGFPGGAQLVVGGEAKDASGFLSPPTSSRQPVYHSTPSLFSPSRHTTFPSSTNPPTPPSAYGDSESSSYGSHTAASFGGGHMQPRPTGKRSWSYSRKGEERALNSHSRRIKIFEGRVRSGSVTKTGNQLFVPITEKTANQPYIVEAVTNQMGRGRWALVSPDGMEIKDMPGTRGIYNILIKALSFPT